MTPSFQGAVYLLMASVLLLVLAIGITFSCWRLMHGHRVTWATLVLALVAMFVQRLLPLERALHIGLYDYPDALLGALLSGLWLLALLGLRLFMHERQRRPQ